MGPPSQQITCITADFDLLLPIFSSIQYQSDLSTVRQKECNQLSYTPRQRKILMIPASNLKGEQEHLKTQFAHHHRQVDYNNNHFILPVHILLSLMAFLGNFLILAALHKVSSLHPPSKLLQRCLATTDLLVSIVSQPFIAPYWKSLVHKEWYLCRFVYKATYITAYMHCVQCGQTFSPVVGAKIQTNSM